MLTPYSTPKNFLRFESIYVILYSIFLYRRYALSSIIERIAAAEAEAEQIRQNAEARAREIISNANREAKESVENAKAEAKARLLKRIEQANEAASRLVKDILATNAKESERAVMEARKKLDAAVSFILERAV